jgi:hypothetical protein
MDDREASDLYRVRKTLCQMLNDRGYVISDDDLLMTLAEFKGLFTGDGGKIAYASGGLPLWRAKSWRLCQGLTC